ncbi:MULTISPECIES: hypothetical protein [Caulobacter]|jgi:hypothetical protein|uniref:hypothetical protein n=1 Tax=Caulobacter TaxID=75 RepID=UPI0012E3B2CF|nr:MULTISPECIES: hypothetical protein [Caulobacter]
MHKRIVWFFERPFGLDHFLAPQDTRRACGALGGPWLNFQAQDFGQALQGLDVIRVKVRQAASIRC